MKQTKRRCLIMSERLDKKIDEAIDNDGTFKSFSERIKEGKKRVEEMLKQADDLDKRLRRLEDNREE
jgi:Arc/MetJ-type ribon-helix-helix transcriptional regulator